MATNLSSLVMCLTLALLISPALSVSAGLNSWCEKTPYPSACTANFAYDTNRYSIPKTNSDFKSISIQSTLQNAYQAQSLNKELGRKCRTENEKAAWSDCLALYDEAIALLNRTADPNIDITEFDSQTWLSAALTNIETCRGGFNDLGVSDSVLPLMPNNVSKLISNALSINNGLKSPAVTNQYEEFDFDFDFPDWVEPGVRRLLKTPKKAVKVVVAKDGSGKYKTIKEALDAFEKRKYGGKRFVIRVKSGVYKENLEIKLKNVFLLGDGLKSTIITGSRSVAGGSTTFRSATVAVTGDDFIARGITFRNTAGPRKGQAVALRSGADLSVFYRCRFEGYQDTLYTHSQRQFYKECYIYGTVDFIFGNAAVVLQNCMIYARRPMKGQKNVITAQGRSDPNQNTGISIHNSRVMASADLAPVISTVKTYLGRPWRRYSRTVFLQCYMGRLVDPAGWLKWNDNSALNTLYYGDYKNMGPGSGTSRRVKWKGYRVITSSSEASKFSVGEFIAGDSWLPATRVPFISGL